ncbi:MAG: hypothetical protein MK085_09185 [Phycisphaerales bacterium]|nr:hypothetical protein [Phycisphaerales bacterium]
MRRTLVMSLLLFARLDRSSVAGCGFGNSNGVRRDRRASSWVYACGLICGALVYGGIAVPAVAQDEQIQVVFELPVAIRGSDLVIPLGANTRDVSWPMTVSAQVGGQEVEADICWLAPMFSASGNWTRPAQPVAVRTVAVGPGGDPVGRPLAVLPVPQDAEGAIQLLGSTWTPTYRDPPPPLEGEPMRGPGRDAEPSLADPFEYFRWVLMAEAEKAAPPEPAGSAVGQRVARSIATEWRTGLYRISRKSLGVAAEIRERLVAVVKDSMRPADEQGVAGWLTGARDLTTLRSILLDPVRSDLESMQASLAWMDSQPSFQAWFESTAGDQVRIAVINPTAGEMVLSARWLGAPGAPVGLVLPPMSLTRHTVYRPELDTDAETPLNEQLTLESERGQTIRMDAGRRSIPVRPPGILFEPVLLPLTLAEISGGFRDAAPGAETTSALLRHRFGRWELFIECFRSTAESSDRLLLQVGDSSSPVAVLEVDAGGNWQIRRGSDEPTLSVQVRSYADRWRCQVILPEPWLVEAITSDSGGAVLLGLRRDGPGEMRQFAGLSAPPWRSNIASIAFDLASWGDGVSREP